MKVQKCSTPVSPKEYTEEELQSSAPEGIYKAKVTSYLPQDHYCIVLYNSDMRKRAVLYFNPVSYDGLQVRNPIGSDCVYEKLESAALCMEIK